MALSSKSRKLLLLPRLLGGSLSQYVPSALLHSSNVAQAQSPAPDPVPLRKMKDSFLDGTSSTYLEELEQRYQADPYSVDKTWASFFRNLESGVPPEAVAEAYHAFEKGETLSPMTAASLSTQTIQESMKLLTMVRAFQVFGHFAANLDPLNYAEQMPPEQITPAFYGFTEKDMDREFVLGTFGMDGFLGENRPVVKLGEIINRLKEVYCGTTGYEYMHVPDRAKCNWLRERIETQEKEPFSKARKLHIMDRLAWSELFESFLANKFTAAKRFGLEGCETLIPGLKAAIDKSAEMGIDSVVIGMPHRGRLNVLANVVRKPMPAIISEFAGAGPSDSEIYFGSGDVKYHLGTSYDRPTVAGKMIHLSLVANPSHLEAVNPVVVGKTRAKQFFGEDKERTKHMPLLLHGDGSFAGQGVVFETMHLSDLPDYTVGGTIHVVVNNQVAFTTDPKKSRSSPYCTDVAKGTNVPVFHVNGDDVEAVVRVFELAAEWRQTWKSDVVVDIVCYRKHGHNEIDEPMFTQPLMYAVIKKHKSALSKYEQELLQEGVATKAEMDAIRTKVNKIMSNEFEEAKSYKPQPRDWLASKWEGFMSPLQKSRVRNTGVQLEILKEVGMAITELPENMSFHKQIKKVYQARQNMISAEDSQGKVDWGMAEALAFGTLISEGNHVRLSGQDVERGTFSHRHAVVHDQNTGDTFTPLSKIFPGQKHRQFCISNSSLSEFAVLGFELGYSLENPNALVLWEAQFGDFANGAQVIFDQFLSSGEAKWLRQSGLVVLLPHGYDGQGPEHSSARMERFLQMSDEDPYEMPQIDEGEWFAGGHLGSQIQKVNWQIVNCTTPANYFHVLRRQLHRHFRKPLVIFTPKNLLRHPDCKSFLWEFDDIPDDHGIQGVRFKRVIMDDKGTMPKSRAPNPPAETNVKRVVFCSGKVFYELHAKREQLEKTEEVALIRIEQLCPFPFDLVSRELRRYPNAEVLWCQEEPMNMGAYFHVQPRMHSCMRHEGHDVSGPLKYAGRIPMASTATGFGQVHAVEQTELLTKAVSVE
ncbi:hypothetical protein BSKO_04201 [Bryopsis sp. KO-2023]|nr:hypothetical protein BSKO_04201 [Bryopsis sp. KO-2023]